MSTNSLSRSASVTGNVVTVFRYSRRTSRAECSCGYTGKARLTGTRAALDALLHAGENPGCLEDWPLILDADRTGGVVREKVLPIGSLLLFCITLGWAIAALAQITGR